MIFYTSRAHMHSHVRSLNIYYIEKNNKNIPIAVIALRRRKYKKIFKMRKKFGYFKFL